MAEPPEALIAAIETDETLPEATRGRYEPLAEAVARQIRAAIIDGRLEPGTRVRQEEIARRLGTSRIPVREALRQLEMEGLVTLVPHVGARVALLDFGEYTELYRMREAVE